MHNILFYSSARSFLMWMKIDLFNTKLVKSLSYPFRSSNLKIFFKLRKYIQNPNMYCMHWISYAVLSQTNSQAYQYRVTSAVLCMHEHDCRHAACVHFPFPPKSLLIYLLGMDGAFAILVNSKYVLLLCINRIFNDHLSRAQCRASVTILYPTIW